MEPEVAPGDTMKGRKVRPDTLTVAPEVLPLTLAEPWRRLVGILVDVVLIGLLSRLSGPFLGVATGAMLFVLLGNRTPVPAILIVFRWGCRAVGVGVVVVSVLALGHLPWLRAEQLNLQALHGATPSAAAKQTVFVPPGASYGQLAHAADELQTQVDALKAELKAQQTAARSWTSQGVALSHSLGVTFGWAGVYFTLLAGMLRGRTPGKLICRTRAVKVNGSPFTFFDAFLRQGGYVAGVAMGFIGFLKLLWEPNRQAVQDRIAATVVVKA